MSKPQQRKRCPPEAIEVAWKLLRNLYPNADGAIRALRRARRSLTADQARVAIAVAQRVLEEAIRIVEPKDRATLEAYRSRVPNGPSAQDRDRYERTLRSKFPECTVAGLRFALQIAVIYHIL